MRYGAVARSVAAVAASLFVLRLLGAVWEQGFDPIFPDSSSYLRVAARSPFSPGFWWDERPPAYPLLLWLVGRSPRAAVVAQTVLYVAAWGWLGAVVIGQLRSRVVSGVAVAVLVLMAIQARWAQWSTLVLTESLSISLAVAGVAAWWRFVDRPTRARTWVAVAITGAWMLVRDANAVTFAAAAVPAAVVAGVLWRRHATPLRRRAAIALTVLVGVAAYTGIAQLATDRGETSFHNNVGLRWLGDDEMRDYFVARGMPLDDALRERAGGDAWADGQAFLVDPRLDEYRHWADGPGRRAAALSFVLKAPWWVDALGERLPASLASDQAAYDQWDVHARLPDDTLGALGPTASVAAFWAWQVAAAAAAVVAWRRRRALGWFVAFLLVPAWIDLYLSFAGDAVEVSRHMVGALVRLSVAAVVAVAIAADALVARATADETSPVEAPTDETAASDQTPAGPSDLDPASVDQRQVADA